MNDFERATQSLRAAGVRLPASARLSLRVVMGHGLSLAEVERSSLSIARGDYSAVNHALYPIIGLGSSTMAPSHSARRLQPTSYASLKASRNALRGKSGARAKKALAICARAARSSLSMFSGVRDGSSTGGDSSTGGAP